MGELRKNIKELIIESGSKIKAKRSAESWFENGKKKSKEKSIQSTSNRFLPGKIYVFRYSPKYIDKLPWFDSNPVVLALNSVDNNDLGINLNLLPIKVKEDMLDRIYGVYSDEIASQSVGGRKNDATRQGMLSINWEESKAYLKATGYDFAIRQYIPSRKSNQAVVSYENWAKIVLCDFADLNGTSYNELFREFTNRRK